MSTTDTTFAFGLGDATYSRAGRLLEVYFPAPLKLPAGAAADVVGLFAVGSQRVTPEQAARLASSLEGTGADAAARAAAALAEFDRPLLATRLVDDTALADTAAAYLKLHLLSHRLALPNTLDLTNIFAQLPNVVWTSRGAFDPADIDAELLRLRGIGEHLTVHAIDKFPRLTDYVIPSGVRIADAARIRLGAYLGEGTTVMHEGFVNFNAGALGPNMIEGRISQGVVVAEHSDLGGSASTMGTLSGGGNVVISIGRHCLIGANAGTGISLGDRCTIEAGLYVTAGTVVDIIDEFGATVRTAKGRELSGASDMLFIRNSRNGRVECRTNRAAIELNAQLHAHN
jgi:2,3,4,5-tetrahydropyridine-2,6-dicarboxylate N-succinyltransferase